MMRDLLTRGTPLAALLLLVLPWFAPAGTAADADAGRLHLVTLTGPGTAGQTEPRGLARAALRARQDALLRMADVSAEPIYRWTTALNGFALPLSAAEARRIARLPGVAHVEPDRIRPLAGLATASAAARSAPGRGGRDVVIGVVDTGLHTDSPVFADRGDGDRPVAFRGPCEPADGWSADDCSGKVVGARHFVTGFGAENLRAGAHVSAYDDNGHGTQVASIAAGNAGVTALDDGTTIGSFSGTAPRARLAVYKACWSAPDPDDDGCSTADVVTAIDRATADGVDVLNLSVTGSSDLDTVDLAALGASEADVVVTAAAGNDMSAAGNAQPWVVTVGATTGPARTGVLSLEGGPVLSGVFTADRGVGPARVVAGDAIPAPGHSPRSARLCTPGSLDAARAAGRIVLCERGRVGRIDKSAAVRLADGVGMVLANRRATDELAADFHAVPSLHVSRADGRALRDALRAGPVRARLAPDATTDAAPPRVLSWSAAGDPAAPVVKPDLVAPGAGLLAATTPAGSASAWTLASGTSVSSATMSGYAARLRAAHPDWSAARIRSALVGSGRQVDGDTSAQGAGLPRVGRAARTGLVLDEDADAFRDAWRTGALDGLNLPSIAVGPLSAPVTVTREVTNVTDEHAYYSSTQGSFARHDVVVTPAALRIPPGETRTFSVRIAPQAGSAGPDRGWVRWRGADGSRVRIPVAVAD